MEMSGKTKFFDCSDLDLYSSREAFSYDFGGSLYLN